MEVPAQPPGSSQHEPESILFESLNASFIANQDAATKDLIGGLDPLGLEIEANGTDFDVREEILDDDNIQGWIRRHSVADTTVGCATGKILRVVLFDRVLYQDPLRPPADALAVRFSRNDLYCHFGCSPLALEKMSLHHMWTRDFPRDQRAGRNISCTGFGTRDFSMIWMNSAGCDSRWAIIVFKVFNSGTRERFLQEARRLRSLYDHPGFLPFVAIGASIRSTEITMDHHMKVISESELKLQRFPNARSASEVYGSVLTVAGAIAGDKRDAQTMDTMVTKCLKMKTQPNIRNNQTLEKKSAALKAAFKYQKQVIRGLIDDAEHGQGYASRQIECVLSFMAQRQQELSIEIAQTQSKLAEASRQEQGISIEIARASKTIAEETKKDGTSMKTLAVVTLVYLPCTTVSSVLAMPLFDWDADDQSIVNPRIWVFFVFAIPLTITTIIIWRLWLRYPTKGKGSRVGNDSLP